MPRHQFVEVFFCLNLHVRSPLLISTLPSMILSNPQLPFAPLRIISLVPSQTELLFSLGLEERVTGITKFCVHPWQWYQTKTRVGGTKTIDINTIRSLSPDLVIANKEENIKEQIEDLGDIPVWVTDVSNLEDALEMISDVGHLTHTERRAGALVTEIRAGFDSLKKLTDHRVAYLVWKEPLMTIGGDTFIHDILERAGFVNVFGHLRRYPAVTLEDLQATGIHSLLLSSEPFPFTSNHITEFQKLLPGVNVVKIDGEMCSWYGSRLLQVPAYLKQFTSRPA